MGIAALIIAAAAAAPPRRADCVATPIPLAWHAGAMARRIRDPRAIRIDQASRPPVRCFRLAAR